MELDFKTVKALSSPTRIKILDRVLEKEATPTSISDHLDRSKSTVSSHLDQLVDAGLVEKDEEEGRRRVVYSPTGKARAIVEGRERKVRFSLASSIVSGLAGVVLVGQEAFGTAYQSAGDAGTAVQEESMNAMMDTADVAETASGGDLLMEPSTAVLALGLFFISVSVIALLYGLAMRSFE